MESKSLFYLSTGIKVNKLVKIKDEILPKTKVQREFATNKAVKSNLAKGIQITKINQPK
jgi:hypothetical protein